MTDSQPSARRSLALAITSGAIALSATGAGLAAAAAGQGRGATLAAPRADATAPLRFEEPAMRVVYSGPDRDAQLFITGGSRVPMRQVTIVDPRGAIVAAARFPGKLGQSDVRFDTPEPTLTKLAAAYPPGRYGWRGVTVSGRPITGVSRLTYALTPVPVITAPAKGSKVPLRGSAVSWKPVAGATRIHVEIEHAPTTQLLTADLPGGATSLTIPDGFLQPDRAYVLDVKAVGPNRNLAVSDRTFRSAAASR